VIEVLALQQIKIIRFSYASLKLNSWYRIEKDVNERLLMMPRAKVVYSMKKVYKTIGTISEE
jgi:hypothetical protein